MSAAELPRRLLDLPDEVLSKVLQHVSVAGKQQHVQLCCMRLRRLLQRSVSRGVWGSIGVRLRRDKVNTIAQLKALLQWLTLRQAGDFRQNTAMQQVMPHLAHPDPQHPSAAHRYHGSTGVR